MGVVYACAFSFMSKYLYQSCGPKPMTRVDINDNNQSSNMYNLLLIFWLSPNGNLYTLMRKIEVDYFHKVVTHFFLGDHSIPKIITYNLGISSRITCMSVLTLAYQFKVMDNSFISLIVSIVLDSKPRKYLQGLMQSRTNLLITQRG
jgi:hypothetical protein